MYHQVKQSLITNNIWWKDEKINPQFLLGRKREEFNSIIDKLDEKRILSIIGPRRVGKSTLIYQTINYLLEDKKIDNKRILFFSGDDPSLFFNENDKVSDVLEIYFNEILEEIYYNEDLKLTIQKRLNEYILVGGYPEYFEERDIDIWQKRLADDIITRGIYKDILTMYNIKNPEILEKLMYYIADNNSQTFSYSGMTGNFSIDTVTLISHIGYLIYRVVILIKLFILGNYFTYNTKIIVIKSPL